MTVSKTLNIQDESIAELLSMPDADDIEFNPPRLEDLYHPWNFTID